MTTVHAVIGRPTGRTEGPEKTTGRATYGLDAALPGMLWLKLLRSPFAHARIVRIDAAKALEVPGVHGVLTGQDVKGLLTGGTYKDEPLLAWDRVRFVGDKVVAVVADDEDIAEQALSLIEVEYEELPAVLTAEDAARPDAPVLHPDYASYMGITPLPDPGRPNVYALMHQEKGDVEQGFREADLVVERTYRTQWSHQAYLEPHTSLVHIDREGKVQVWVASQGPIRNRDELARLMDLPLEDIVVNPSYVGGSFGGKGTTTGLLLSYLFAKRTGRPVKFAMDYTEELMAMDPRHPSTMRIKAGVRRDGTLTAWQAEVHFATGGYAAYAPVPPLYIRGISEIAGPYKIPHVLIDSYQVYTNTVPCGFARAPGEFQGIFAGESHMDVIARELGMDPLELRLRNAVHEGDPLPDGHVYQEVRLEETLRAAAETAGWNDPKPANVGRGIAVGHRSQIGGDAHVAVAVHADGKIEAGVPSFDPGAGTFTIVAQAVAEELGVPARRVAIVPYSTAQGPFDFGVGGSRGARVWSIAGYEAGQDARRKLQRLAAELFGWAEEGLAFRDGRIVNPASGASVALEEVAARVGEPVTGQGDVEEDRDSPYTSFGAHVAEVAVDLETGQVRVLKYTAAHETGKVLNPITFQGQIEGGIVYGLGETLMEELVVDESGRVANASFADFKIPTERDIPPLTTVILESDAGHGPYKVRGIGEHSNIQVAPAIVNAIEDAVGVRVYELPVSPERLLRAVQAKGRGARKE